jgi:hypothetical protein
LVVDRQHVEKRVVRAALDENQIIEARVRLNFTAPQIPEHHPRARLDPGESQASVSVRIVRLGLDATAEPVAFEDTDWGEEL